MQKPSILKESDYLIAWVLFFICATIGGAVAGALVSGIIGGILRVMHASPQVISRVCGLLGFMLALPISYFLFRFVVARFIVEKVEAAAAATATPAPEPMAQAA